MRDSWYNSCTVENFQTVCPCPHIFNMINDIALDLSIVPLWLKRH
jgi:hypothetical protein